MPHDDKHYPKLQRTFKFVFDALCLVALVLIVGLLLIWLYDKIGGTFLPRPWKIVLLIIFAILAALTRVPEYIHDLRKICSIRSSCSILPLERNRKKKICHHLDEDSGRSCWFSWLFILTSLKSLMNWETP